MPEVLTVNDTIMCPHGGTVSFGPLQQRAKAEAGLMLRPGDVFTIAGCPYWMGPTYHPCVTVEWSAPATRVKAGGEAVLTSASVGICKAADQAPQGTAMIQKTQLKVVAT